MTEKTKGYFAGVCIIILGVIFGLYQMNEYNENNVAVQSGNYILTEATISEYEWEYEYTSSNKKRKKCRTTYEYVVRGRTYEGASTKCYTLDPTGSTISIYYDQYDPYDDFLKSETSIMMFVPFLAVPFGGYIIYKAYKD